MEEPRARARRLVAGDHDLVRGRDGQLPADHGDLRRDLRRSRPEADIAEAAKLNDHLDAWKAIFTAPQCLWHSDLRADNLLFDAQDGTVPVAVLDWQGVGYGAGTIDVAYFLATSLTTEDSARANATSSVRATMPSSPTASTTTTHRHAGRTIACSRSTACRSACSGSAP